LTTIQTNPMAVQLPRVSRNRVTRYGLATAGVGCVGMGALGAVVPGLPTTVFLIIAAWCFARSCPWLTDKLIHNRFFAPFARYLVPGAVMPARAKAISIGVMWVAIAASCWLIIARESPGFVPVTVVLSGVVGTWFIVRQGRKHGVKSNDPERIVRHPLGRTVGRQERGHKNPACTITTGASSKTL
jgi:uncharacterized membrane protein YbaN (DUF454 family)